MSSDLNIIVGLGLTGLSCARFLHSKAIPFAIMDTRDNPPQLDEVRRLFPDIKIATGGVDHDLLEKATRIILSPGIPVYTPGIAAAWARGVPVIGDIELFAEEVTAPVIAITGTNAKSTVTTLVGDMAKASSYNVQVGGNLGLPALDLLLDKPDANLFVLELSSFQLETTNSLKPAVATVLNITPDHMDRYTDLSAYQQAKHRIYQNCDIAVCNRNDLLTDTDADKKFYFTLHEPKENEFGLLNQHLAFGKQLLLATNELPVRGKHYQENALAALAIGHAFGFPMETMVNVLKTFTGLPHRCQFVRELDGVRWYNDSKGTNVGATEAALKGLGSEMDGKLVLIAGGMGKNADFSSLVPLMEKYARHIVLIGQAAKELSTLIANRVPTSTASDMTDAVQQAQSAAKKGDSVLLSPACASFDMFKNFEHRGDVFVETVNQI